MSEDEFMALAVSCVVSLVTWFGWIRQTTATAPRCSRFRHRWPLLLYPALGAAALFGVLRQLSSHDVRSSALYIGFYLVLVLRPRSSLRVAALPRGLSVIRNEPCRP
jgi:hypothetical protein